MAFYDIEDNDSYFDNAAEMIRHYFASSDVETDEELWYNIQNLSECQIDPLRITACDYRPFDTKYMYYGSKMGLISHPRYEVMKHLLPWYYKFTLTELCKNMADYPRDMLRQIVQKAEQDWFRLPLNAKFLSNLNLWRTAIYLQANKMSETIQLELF